MKGRGQDASVVRSGRYSTRLRAGCNPLGLRATNSTIQSSTCGRCCSMTKPASLMNLPVSLSRRHPPAAAAHAGAAMLCSQRPGCHGKWTCSSMSRLPPGTSTRHNSAKACAGSAPRPRHHARPGLERDDLGAWAVPAQLAAGPGADLEHATAGTRRQPAPPGAHSGALERPH